MAGSLHVGLAALGAAIGVGLIGAGAAIAVGRNPGAATPVLVQSILSIAFAEAIVFYALFRVREADAAASRAPEMSILSVAQARAQVGGSGVERIATTFGVD